MPVNLANDWNNLAANIRGIGQDQFNAGLGLARLLSEDQLRKADVALKDVQTRDAELALREKEKKEAYLNSPATFSGALQMFGSNAPSNEMLATSVDIMKSFGLGLADETNPDPNQALIWTKDGKPVTNRDIAMNAPKFAGYMVATTDPFQLMQGAMVNLKKKLGSTSEGPTLSDEELQSFATDPAKKELLSKYQGVAKDYARYSAEPALAYRAQLNNLTQVEGAIKAVGGDTSIIAERKKAIEVVLAQQEKQKTEEQQFVSVTPEQSAALGIPTGTRLDQKQIVEVGKGLSGFKSSKYASDTAAQAQRDVANIHGATSRATATIAADDAKLATERNNFFNHLDNNIPRLAMEQFDKTARKDPTGTYLDAEGNPLSQADIQKGQLALVQRMKQDTIQQAYDMGQLKRLGIEPPAYIDKSPVPVREEFKASVGSILASLDQVNEKDAQGKNLKGQVTRSLIAIRDKVKSGDTAQIDQARKDLLSVTNSVQQYLNSKKPNVNSQIQRRVKDMTNPSMTGNVGDFGGYGLPGLNQEKWQ